MDGLHGIRVEQVLVGDAPVDARGRASRVADLLEQLLRGREEPGPPEHRRVARERSVRPLPPRRRRGRVGRERQVLRGEAVRHELRLRRQRGAVRGVGRRRGGGVGVERRRRRRWDRGGGGARAGASRCPRRPAPGTAASRAGCAAARGTAARRRAARCAAQGTRRGSGSGSVARLRTRPWRTTWRASNHGSSSRLEARVPALESERARARRRQVYSSRWGKRLRTFRAPGPAAIAVASRC
jgi:hypothetical protein